ncbi:MAG: efflux RND transporter periplasmic adaptor subunit [Phycisphaerales bacterium]|jgi:RND family efflux transporter MFP subunit|nr:efflux RND transporter periplasmic adaptor subunit [Phycisphaerales bacterium]
MMYHGPFMLPSKYISFLSRAVVAIVLLLFSFGIVAILVKTKPLLETEQGERALPAVIVMEAGQVPMLRRTIGYGTADAINHADVPTEVSSTVTVVPPTSRVGRMVKQGDLLVELDESDFKQQLVRAEQAVASAKSERDLLAVERDAADKRAALSIQDLLLAEQEFERVQKAFDNGAAKEREVDLAKQKLISVKSASINSQELANRFPALEEQLGTTIATREAELELAKENVHRCKILSPIDGVLQEIDVRVGEHVNNGKRVARVINSGTIEVPLRLPSFARAHVNVGDDVNLRSAGFGKRFWKARVSRIAPEDDSQTRTMIIYVDINQDPADPNRVPPGLFVRGEVKNLKSQKPRWIVPRRAIREDRIMVIRDAILRSIPVTIDYSVTGEAKDFGLPDLDWAVLDTPLKAGDLVVVDPGGNLRDGMDVRPIYAKEVSLE